MSDLIPTSTASVIEIEADPNARPGLIWWRAICECGWHGRWRPTVAYAHVDADQHGDVNPGHVEDTIHG